MSATPKRVIEDTKYYDTAQMCVRNHCNRTTLARKEKQGVIPPHVNGHLGKSKLWVQAHVHEYERRREPELPPADEPTDARFDQMWEENQESKEQEAKDARKQEVEAQREALAREREQQRLWASLKPKPVPPIRERRASHLSPRKVRATLKRNQLKLKKPK
jgi:hypothetical protein